MNPSREHPTFQAFFAAAYEKIRPAMKSMLNDPLSQSLTREEIGIGLATACVCAAALAIAPTSVTDLEAEEISDSMVSFLNMTRQKMRSRGIGVLRS